MVSHEHPHDEDKPSERPELSLELSRPAIIVATGAICFYIAALCLLFAYRADPHWDRMLFLLSGYESIVFAAAGALFGTSIQRTSVHSAHREAREARGEARSERSRADELAGQAARGRTLASAIKAAELVPAAQPPVAHGTIRPDAGAPRDERPGGNGSVPAAPDARMRFLIDLASQLFPESE
jgi:hypothetical protein